MSNRRVAVTVSGEARSNSEHAFDVIAPIDLGSIFDRWMLIPGVEGVADQTGEWDAPGQTRTVILSDGSKVSEELLALDRPRSFEYRVGPLPSPIGRLARFAFGKWTFEQAGPQSTAITWTYSFEPARGRGALVRFLIAPVWRQYARRALNKSISAVEAKLN